MTASHPHGQVRMYVSQETLQSQRQCGFPPDSYIERCFANPSESNFFPFKSSAITYIESFILESRRSASFCRICSCCKSDACSGVFSSGNFYNIYFRIPRQTLFIFIYRICIKLFFIFPTYNIVYCIMFLPLLSYA